MFAIIKSMCLAFILMGLGCAHQVVGKWYSGPLTGQWPSVALPSDSRADISRLKGLVGKLQARGNRALSVREFENVMNDLQHVERKYGALNTAYSEMAAFAAISIAPQKWVRLSLKSFCLNSGKASPSPNEVYTFRKIPSEYQEWLPDMMRYAKLQGVSQKEIQGVVWRLSKGARYRDLGKSDQAILKAAIPDIDKPFSNFGKFMKAWVAGWGELFQSNEQMEQEVSQRKSNLPMPEPITRWADMGDNLVGRADLHSGYSETYLTIANVGSVPALFSPLDYILAPARKNVQSLALAPAWDNSSWAELARLIDQAYSLIIEAGVVLVPGLNDAVDLYEFLYGKDFLSDKVLEPEDRALAALGLVAGSGRGYRKGGEELLNVAGEAGKPGAKEALSQAERIAEKYQKYTNPKFARQLEKQLAEHGPNSIKRALKSLEKVYNEHSSKLPDMQYKSSIEKEMRAFRNQIETIKEFMHAKGLK